MMRDNGKTIIDSMRYIVVLIVFGLRETLHYEKREKWGSSHLAEGAKGASPLSLHLPTLSISPSSPSTSSSKTSSSPLPSSLTHLNSSMQGGVAHPVLAVDLDVRAVEQQLHDGIVLVAYRPYLA